MTRSTDFVLFGFPKQEIVGGLYNYNANPVLRAVAKCFRFRKSTTEGRGKSWKKFCEHRQKYALFDSGGSAPVSVSGSIYIQRARERMREIDGMEDLVRRMLHYDPTRRVMMEGALRNPVFDCASTPNQVALKCFSHVILQIMKRVMSRSEYTFISSVRKKLFYLMKRNFHTPRLIEHSTNVQK